MDLEEILKSHKEYLLSNSKKGKRANLRGALLRNADLRNADLRNVDLRKAYLRKAYLKGAILINADLEGANLEKAYFRDADLRWADLQKANLRWADLQDANLRGANLNGADLRWADLRGAIGVVSTAKGCQLIAWKHKGEFWFNAGCKSLLHKDALEYWGSPNYPNKARGKAYCKAIEFLIRTWPWD